MLFDIPQTAASSSRSYLVIVCWSKKKAQTKKPKKADIPEDAKTLEAKSNDAPQPPPRIMDTGPMSLKRQLRIVRRHQQAEREIASPPKPVARRTRMINEVTGAPSPAKPRILQPEPAKVEVKPLTEEQIAQKAAKEKAQRRAKHIASLYNKKIKGPTQAVLLIDGYNIMLQWLEEPLQKRLKKTSGTNFEVIRDAFLRDVSAYSSRELRVMVAFDAMGNPNAPPIARETCGGLEIIFVGYAEADVFISQEAVTLRKSGTPYVLVASNDHDVSESCWTDDIWPMSSHQFLQEIARERRAFEKLQRERVWQAAGQDLGARMMAASPRLYMELEKMRRGFKSRA